MLVLHVPFGYSPDPIGGTERYVEGLVCALSNIGVRSGIAAPSPNTLRYVHMGIHVDRFKVSDTLSLEDLYGEGDREAADQFGIILDRVLPDVVHLHAFTSGVSLRTVEQAQKRCIPIVFTYHTPTVSCARGTLREMGSSVCDGRVDIKRCTKCVVNARGIPAALANLVAAIRSGFGERLSQCGLCGGVWTALRMSELVARRHRAFMKLMATTDHVVAVCDWVRTLLVDNGVPAEKITVSRQGLTGDPVEVRVDQRGLEPKTIRIAFLGRVDGTKGIDLLLRAILGLVGLPIELDIYGVAQGESGQMLLRALQSLCGSDKRIRFCAPISPDEVVQVLSGYDALAVPSQWLETGPLVVYEAFGAGLPVIGSDLGGIAELVTHERDGLLVMSDSLVSWQNTLKRLVSEPDLLPRLRRGVRPPRIMETVAEEMMMVYGKVLRDGTYSDAKRPA